MTIKRSKPEVMSVWLNMSHMLNRTDKNAPDYLQVKYVFDSTFRVYVLGDPCYYMAPVDFFLGWRESTVDTTEREKHYDSVQDDLDELRTEYLCSSVDEAEPVLENRLNNKAFLEELVRLEEQDTDTAVLLRIVEEYHG